ncbi:uncharacterized protein TNCV_4496661 [Trichonephila clavipes]|nr:uncharacterized protein TNCV_4496661 [Trichonephila clavipes]
MPKLELPQFHGEMEFWITFKELFQATVIDNSDLTEIDKLQYLFASVKGNAAKLIRGFAIKRKFKKLLGIIMVEINQLSELIIINHCTSKLHEEIAHRWELTLKPDTYPTLQAFRMFIESEPRALGLLSGNADAPKSKLGTNLLEGMPIFGPAGTPTAIPTKLGYILSGKIYAPPLEESIVNSSLNDQLSELWKLEEVPKTNAKIQIPDPCEESFSKSVKRNNEDTEVEAKSIIIEIQNLLKSGGFILRKWSSSHPKVLQDLDTSLLASKPIHSLGDEESKQRVLGLIWNLKTDSIQVKVVHEEIVKTKDNYFPSLRKSLIL